MHVFPSSNLIARKQHKCTWCGERILSGEIYVRWANIDDSFFINKMHQDCAGAMLDEFRETQDNEYLPYENERPTKGNPHEL